ncbi:MAG: prolipoprotein diacylglyceryl transferase [Candidatus Kerfeldbacteria bacterium]|nr:prolipoprotein diacylglyceryl transferase [Candidatus Kerfeldbacteria bacterium]
MFDLLHTFHPSPLLATVGPFVIRWYGLTLALGALAGFLTLRQLGRKIGWTPDAVTVLFVSLLAAGVLGARLYHVLNEPAYYAAHPLDILQVWRGGLAIHGGLIAGVLTLVLFSRRWQTRLLRLTDIVVPAVAIGQAIGRWGNYFNQELFGQATGLPWGIPIDPANRPPGFETVEFFHPTFLYESLWLVAVFLFLRLLHRRRAAAGAVTFAYLGLAALGRLGTELLRIDDTPLLLGIRLPLLVSGTLMIVGLAGLWYCVRRSPGKPQRPG